MEPNKQNYVLNKYILVTNIYVSFFMFGVITLSLLPVNELKSDNLFILFIIYSLALSLGLCYKFLLEKHDDAFQAFLNKVYLFVTNIYVILSMFGMVALYNLVDNPYEVIVYSFSLASVLGSCYKFFFLSMTKILEVYFIQQDMFF